MKDKDYTIVYGVTVKVGDIVKIKFKPLEKILQDSRASCRLAQIVEFYHIDDHMTSFLQGGHFKVEGVADKDYGYLRLNENERRTSVKRAEHPKTLSEITIHDHVVDATWVMNDIIIDSISVENEVAESYFSEVHQLSIVLIDGVLFLNGHPVTADDSKIYEMFEKVMADAAINRALSKHDDDDEEDQIKF